MKKYQARTTRSEFLNTPGFHGAAAIRTYVEDTRDRKVEYEEPPSPRILFEMSDCSGGISIDFNAWSKEQRENAIAKANTIVEVITEFRDALVEEFEFVDERAKMLRKKAKKKRKKKKK